MLTRMRLQGFKSWSDTGDVDLRPITAFFGANSSGKTNLLQALLLLKQTADSSDRSLVFHFGNGKTPVDLGDLHSVMHQHAAEGMLGFDLDWEAAAPLTVTDAQSGDRAVAESRRLGFQVQAKCRTSARRASAAVNAMTYKVGDAAFGLRKKPRSPGYDLFSDGADFAFVRGPGQPRNLPAPIKCCGFPDRTRAHFQNAGFVADLEVQLLKRLDRTYYLGPLRDHPKRTYIWSGVRPADVGPAGELAVSAILASRARGDSISPGKRKKRHSLEEHIAHWLRKLKLAHDFEIAPLAEGSPVFEVRVRRSPTAPSVLLTDIGFGVPQILPVLTLCFYAPEGSTIILEQPENRLHPVAQSGLADALIDAWRTRKVQILLESHSEPLLHRLQRRVAEESISDQEIRLYFCKARGGSSALTRLDLDPYGVIQNWPKDFFGDDFGEIAATHLAALKRQRQAERQGQAR